MRRLEYIVLVLTILLLLLLIASLMPTPHRREENIVIPVTGTVYQVTAEYDYPEWLWLGTTGTLNLMTRMEPVTETADLLPPDTTLEGTLDSRCLSFDPPGDSMQAIVADTTQQWYWELIPIEPPNSCDLMLVVGLRQPDKSAMQVLYVRKLTIETMSFMGLPVTTVRIIGLIGGILGLLLLAYLQLQSIRAQHAKRKVTT